MNSDSYSNLKIKDLTEGKSFSDFIFMVKDCKKGITDGEKSYLTIELQDNSGTIEGKYWNATEDVINLVKIGKILKCNGVVNLYKGKLQVKFFSISELDDSDNVDYNNFLIQSPIPLTELTTKLKSYINSVSNQDCKSILNAIFKKYGAQFIEYPAAVRNHHEFYHGLIFHTVSMCDVADFLAKHYPDVNRDILITGCLLHDIGKVIELSGPVSTKYTDEGNLLGHLTIGMSIVKEVADELKITSEVPLLIEHMILSHHGKLEYGAAVLPSTREALLLSMIDDMDAKMMVLDKAYAKVNKGEYTERIFALDNRSFYKSKE